MNTITLIHTAGGWLARHSDPDVRFLFGTDTLPTAFTGQADCHEVLAAMKRLNPEKLVLLEPYSVSH